MGEYIYFFVKVMVVFERVQISEEKVISHIDFRCDALFK